MYADTFTFTYFSRLLTEKISQCDQHRESLLDEELLKIAGFRVYERESKLKKLEQTLAFLKECKEKLDESFVRFTDLESKLEPSIAKLRECSAENPEDPLLPLATATFSYIHVQLTMERERLEKLYQIIGRFYGIE